MDKISKSAKKSKTPGPGGKKKAEIFKRKALSEGGPIMKNKVSQSGTKTAKTPKKFKAADEKIKLMYGEESDEEDGVVIQKTPVSKKGKKTPKSSGKSKPDAAEETVSATPKVKKGANLEKSEGKKAQESEDDSTARQKTPVGTKGKKTPKSSRKSKPDQADENLTVTPKIKTPKGAAVTPKVKTPKVVTQRSMSEGPKQKKLDSAKSVGKKQPASAGGQLKKQTKKEDLSQVKLPFDIEDDYDEDEDDDFEMDEDDDEEDDAEFDDDDEDDDDGVLDDDDEDEDFDEEEEDDESGSSSYSDDSDISLESDDDDEITFNPSAKKKTTEAGERKKTPKVDKSQEMTQIITNPSKTPKSALKTPGTAKSTGKKVSIVVTSPDKEVSSKKVVATPHPSLTKKRRPEEEEHNKENVDENGVATVSNAASNKKASKKDKKSQGKADEEPLHKQLSFGDDDESDDEMEEKTVQQGKVKGQAGKRKLKESDEDEDESDEYESDEDESDDDGPPTKKGKLDDGIYYHCGNLPPNVDKQMVSWFFAEADVEIDRIYIKREKVVRTEVTDIKKSKKKYRKKTTKAQHCFAILKCKSKEDAKKLDALNGSEFTATDGKWRSYDLTIYPLIQGPKATIKEEDSVHIRPLNNKTEDEDLQAFFKENGVEPLKVRIARRGIRQISKGFAFAWFKSKADVQKAIKLSGKEVQGFKLNITQAKPKIQGPKKYSYKIGSNLDMKERENAKVDLKKKKKK
ncbi:uncharacterized protein [Amphiura filiformis]|uniref:uncharacterized protein n=1 Tax=Amphiura filiformis TaxID=82378 RepID=UPI003B218B5A